ncbi:MAG: nucleotidyltransferase domain-containing protein [Magnetococcales bacterium]|nr:nucleotidyltransferase domain-containing protein [Magnetococcales bacterium]
MAARDLSTLYLEPRHLHTVRQLLQHYVPWSEAWIYGSRVTGTGHETSDLDLEVRNPVDPDLEQPGIGAVRTAFMLSDLPIRVEVEDWARIPDSFRQEIVCNYIVAQMASQPL